MLSLLIFLYLVLHLAGLTTFFERKFLGLFHIRLGYQTFCSRSLGDFLLSIVKFSLVHGCWKPTLWLFKWELRRWSSIICLWVYLTVLCYYADFQFGLVFLAFFWSSLCLDFLFDLIYWSIRYNIAFMDCRGLVYWYPFLIGFSPVLLFPVPLLMIPASCCTSLVPYKTPCSSLVPYKTPCNSLSLWYPKSSSLVCLPK